MYMVLAASFNEQKFVLSGVISGLLLVSINISFLPFGNKKYPPMAPSFVTILPVYQLSPLLHVSVKTCIH